MKNMVIIIPAYHLLVTIFIVRGQLRAEVQPYKGPAMVIDS